jgi:hypothetical protein
MNTKCDAWHFEKNATLHLYVTATSVAECLVCQSALASSGSKSLRY